jgi:predicted nuclease of predicted toxin-antitoxin system
VRFFLDHDVPRQIAEVLQRHGHDVVVLKEALPVETPDEDVIGHAARSGRILITCNRDDFLVLAAGREHMGLIILIRRRSSVAEQGHLLRLLQVAGEEGISGNINFA